MILSISQLIAEARKLANNSNAIFCAEQALVNGNDNAKYWALKSLAYSVGKFHPLYIANS